MPVAVGYTVVFGEQRICNACPQGYYSTSKPLIPSKRVLTSPDARS